MLKYMLPAKGSSSLSHAVRNCVNIESDNAEIIDMYMVFLIIILDLLPGICLLLL